MLIRNFALALGVLYALVGILGFIPGLTQPPPADAPALTVGAGYGLLLGLFPVNVVHNLIHLLVGVLGIAAYWSLDWSRTYARGIFIVFALLTIMGLIPGLNTTFGLAPLFGNDIWLHALTALAGGYFGFLAPVEAVRLGEAPGPTGERRVP